MVEIDFVDAWKEDCNENENVQAFDEPEKEVQDGVALLVSQLLEEFLLLVLFIEA